MCFTHEQKRTENGMPGFLMSSVPRLRKRKAKKKMEEAENPHERLKKMKQKRDENRGEFLIRPGERKTL